MPTKFMKLGFDEKVLRALANDTDGYVLDVGFNYYRGTPISAVERLELTVDGERVDDAVGLITDIRQNAPGDEITLTLEGGDEITVTLGQR